MLKLLFNFLLTSYLKKDSFGEIPPDKINIRKPVYRRLPPLKLEELKNEIENRKRNKELDLEIYKEAESINHKR